MTLKPSKPKKKTAKKKPTALRKRAESMLAKQKDRLRELSAADMKKLVHELCTHQIELEMQNEELRSAQAELESSRARYVDLYDFSPTGYFTFDKKGVIKEANLTGAGMLGSTKRLLVNKPMLPFIDPAYRTTFSEHLREVFRTQASATCGVTLLNRDGTSFHVQFNSLAFATGDGDPGLCRTAISDINERKLAEEALRQSEVKYRELVENANSIIIKMDCEGKISFFNEYAQQFFGYSLDEALGQNVEILVPSIESRSERRLDKMVDRILDNPDGFVENINENVRKNGERVWISWRNKAMRDASGEIVGNLAIGQDITERMRAEEALRESEEQFRTLAGSIPNLAWWANADGYITWYNRRWYEYTGTTPEQMEGWGWQSVHDPNVLPKVLEQWKASIATGQPFDMEFPLRGADGAFRTFLTRVIPLKDPSDVVLRWFGTNTDISVLKQAEKDLRENELKASALINTADESIWLFGIHDDIFAANVTAARRLGMSVRDVVGKKWTDLIPPAVAASRKQKVAEVVSSGNPLHFEDERAGMTFDHIVYPVRDETGEITAVAFFSRDITERKLAENERERLLAEVQRRATELDAVFKVLPYLVSVHDQDGKYLRANQAVLDLFGFDPATATREEIARRVRAHFPDGRPLTPENMPSSRALNGETVKDVEYVITNERGEEHVLMFNAIPLKQGERVYGAVFSQLDITERKRAEKERTRLLHQVQDQAAELDATIASIAIGLIVYDPAGKAVRMNAFAKKIFSSELFQNKSIEERRQVLHWEKENGQPYQLEEIPVARALRGETTRNVVLATPLPDRKLWISASAAPIRTPDGTMLGAVASFIDITERKQAEEEKLRLLHVVQEEKDRLSALINSINDEIWFADSQKNFTLANPSALREFGIAAGARDVEKFSASLEVFRPDGSPRPVEEAPPLRALLGEIITNQEEIVRTPNARELRHRQVSAAPVRDANGTIIGSVSVVHDITERKRAEDALRQSETKFKTIFDTSVDAIGVSKGGKHVFVNAAYLSLYGYGSEQELAGRPILDLIAPSEREKIREYAKQRASGSAAAPPLYETRGLRKDGSEFDMDVRATTYTLSGDVYTLVIIRDITERKQAEEALKTAHREIERRAYELEAVNRELEAFSYTVSHDLKAPLRSIDGFAKALLEDYQDKLDTTGADYLKRVTAATLRMNQFIEAMLNMARLTRGELHEKTVNLSSLAEVAAHELKKSDPKRQAEFVIAEKVNAQGDQDMLRIVLQNLLDNAWKFTGRHSTAKIEFGSVDMDGKTVYFVRDDGAGFDMKYADKLFQPFKRLHAESEFPGLGIGLAIAHRIILRHGGRMWAEAEVEKGATFYFTL